MSNDIHVSVNNPDDPYGMPSYDGLDIDAHRTLAPGRYPCTVTADNSYGELVVTRIGSSFANVDHGGDTWDGGVIPADPTTIIEIPDPDDPDADAKIYRGPIENVGTVLPRGRWFGNWRVTATGPAHGMIGATYLVTVYDDLTADGVRVS